MDNIQGSHELAIKLDRLLVGVSDAEITKTLTAVGMDIKRVDMPDGFRSDLGGDLAMRNWPRRGDAMELRTDFKVSRSELSVRPQGRSYGPLSMLENGRTPRAAGQFRSGGVRTTKGGATSTRLRQVTRTVGPMAAKNTWSDGVDVVGRRLPNRLQTWLNTVVRQSRIGR